MMKKGMKGMKAIKSGKGKIVEATKTKSRVVKSSSSGSSSDSSGTNSGSEDERQTKLSQRTVANVGEMSLE